jgi:DNA replication protein DnaC
MSDNDLGERLRRLGLRVDHAQLAAFLTHVHKSHLGPTETLEQLADLEERSRVAVNLARRTRFACLGSFKTLDRFDWDHPEKIDRPLIERLFELEFIDRGENALFKGGSGLGKTMIALNVGQAALAAGFTVRFSTLAAALADLLAQESLPAFERRIRRYTSPDLLILDELGYLPCDSRAAELRLSSRFSGWSDRSERIVGVVRMASTPFGRGADLRTATHGTGAVLLPLANQGPPCAPLRCFASCWV